MRAIILAGGMGKRLMPLTKTMPKPMMPIIDRPILEYIVRLLLSHGIAEIGITLGYKSEHIVRYFGDGSDFGVDITYFSESGPLGTAGAVKNAESFIEGDFLVMSGDALTNIDLTALIASHSATDSLVTMAVQEVDNPTSFGVLTVDERGHITSYEEKPKTPRSSLVNMGIYVMQSDILSYIPRGVMFDFSHDLFPHILPYMYAHISHCYWSDIGTLSSYYLANNDVVNSPTSFGVTI